MSDNKEPYHVIVFPAKPYVKKYLENEFGNPANFSKDRHIYKYFISLLDRQVHRNNNRINFKQFGRLLYKAEVEISICKEVYDRYGYSLSKAAVLDFNGFIEEFIKKQSRLWVACNISHGMGLKESVNDFYKTFKFSEDSFSMESVIKDFQRNGKLI